MALVQHSFAFLAFCCVFFFSFSASDKAIYSLVHHHSVSVFTKYQLQLHLSGRFSTVSGLFELYDKRNRNPTLTCKNPATFILVTRATGLMVAHDPRLGNTAGVQPKSGCLDLTVHGLKGKQEIRKWPRFD